MGAERFELPTYAL